MNLLLRSALVVLLLLTGISAAVAAPAEIGKVVALRGAVTIERAGSRLPAQVKSGIGEQDTLRTAAGSRVKLLFQNGSILTLGEKSTLIVQEYLDRQGGEGKSVFNLLEGKMRSVVGRTRFEVQTPTAVAAARGTVIYFEVGGHKQQIYSKIVCLEGRVEVWRRGGGAGGGITLVPGKMLIVKLDDGHLRPVEAPPAESGNENFNPAPDDQEGAGEGGMEPGPGGNLDPPAGQDSPPVQKSPAFQGTAPLRILLPGRHLNLPSLPPIRQEPLRQPTRVEIDISIPLPTR